MRIKKYLNKRLNVNQLIDDINSRELVGVHFHEKGSFDENHDIIELIIGQGKEYTYSFKLYIIEDIIVRFERVKFQWECGGWRSHDHVLKRFPLNICCEEITDKIMEQYLE